MRPVCLAVFILPLVTIIAARSLSVRRASYLEALKRRFNSGHNNYMQHNLISWDTAKKRIVSRKYRLVTYCIIFSYRQPNESLR
jgi:hypothetical protein